MPIRIDPTGGGGSTPVPATLQYQLDMMPRGLVDASSAAFFKAKTTTTFIYRGSGAEITGAWAKVGAVDTGASQPTVDVTINGTPALTAPISISGSPDTEVSGVVDTGANTLADGDIIELDVVQGTTGDADDLHVSLAIRSTTSNPQYQLDLMPRGLLDANTATFFKDKSETSFVHHGASATIDAVFAKVGAVDTGISQPTVDITINGTPVLTGPITISGVADTDVAGVVDTGANALADGDVVEITVVAGTSGDAEDLHVSMQITNV